MDEKNVDTSQYIKHIDFSKNWFTANGTKYIILPSLNAHRHHLSRKFQAEIGYGRSLKQMFEEDQKVWDALNAKEGLAEAAVLVYNKLQGYHKLMDQSDEIEEPVFKLCSLFIIYEGEDIAQWNEADYGKKCLDWSKEGIDRQDFFTLAGTILNDFIQSLKTISQLSLEVK